ncbi:restriction endonuclease subunit S [Salegentibacter sediminis]|uniref:restriction endonuclease subunit S n=1 Tax=Salegentibacter sediminis TaxID=1930251 RepID=UPI0009C10041|nr:restriction endonuclease subunit S [Salegentibacter sediminis]
MEAILEQELKLDKSSWQKVRFGDVVKEPKESVKNPVASGIQHVIGLEHIEPEDIHLRNHATLEESTTFTKAFKKGDVLFGRRRAYLKKAALAPFSGICSGDITVFRAKENLLPEILPFIVNNDKFFDYAVKHSAGGLSPRVKFKDLAKYEFLFPPKDQQAQLAELLWAMDEVIEKNNNLLKKSIGSKKSFFNDVLYQKDEKVNSFFKSKYPVVKLGKLLEKIQYGISESLSEEKVGVPILRMNNLQGGTLDVTDLKYYSPVNEELKDFMLKKGDILFNRTNSFDLVGKVSIFREEKDYSFASYLIRLKVDNTQLDSEFLNFFLNSAVGLSKIRKYRTPGVNQSNINAQSLKKINLPYPPLETQKKLMQKIRSFEIAEDNLNEAINSAKALQKSLINQIF